MTLQEGFDKVWDWFVAQGHGASIADEPNVTSCRYRGRQGGKCAIGVFIPDEVYVRHMDDTGTVAQLLYQYPELMKYMPECKSIDTLRELQLCHDDPAFSELPNFRHSIKTNLEEFAARNHLRVPTAS